MANRQQLFDKLSILKTQLYKILSEFTILNKEIDLDTMNGNIRMGQLETQRDTIQCKILGLKTDILGLQDDLEKLKIEMSSIESEIAKEAEKAGLDEKDAELLKMFNQVAELLLSKEKETTEENRTNEILTPKTPKMPVLTPHGTPK